MGLVISFNTVRHLTDKTFYSYQDTLDSIVSGNRKFCCYRLSVILNRYFILAQEPTSFVAFKIILFALRHPSIKTAILRTEKDRFRNKGRIG